MKKTLTLLLIILSIGCQKDEVLRLKQYGTVTFNGNIFLNETAKYEVPNCSNETPTKIQYVFVDDKIQNWTREANITIQENNINVLEEIELPIGVYTVEDIAIATETGIVTHRVPSTQTIAFDFSAFTNISTPFDIEILPSQETTLNAELLCYTSEILNMNGTANGTNKIVDLQTLYFELPAGNCINRLVIIIDDRVLHDYGVNGNGIRGIPILKEFELISIIAYQDFNLASLVQYEEYNPDGIMEYSDVVQFGNVCN